MSYTQLSLSATPGRRYSFSAKSKGEGRFTELSVMATPGQIHSFSAKTPAIGDHTGLFTWLSSIATPGQRLSFLAKTPYVEPEETPEQREARRVRSSGGVAPPKYADKFRDLQLEQIQREDEEMLRILIQAVTSEIL